MNASILSDGSQPVKSYCYKISVYNGASTLFPNAVKYLGFSRLYQVSLVLVQIYYSFKTL